MHCKIHSGIPKSYQNKIAIPSPLPLLALQKITDICKKSNLKIQWCVSQNETANLKARVQ